MSTSPERGLYRWEWLAVIALLTICTAFGFLVVKRSAHSELRMTDYSVYSRSAWAVRIGQDPYTIADDRGLHYCYPPTFLVFMLPLADPPNGADRSGYLPFDVNVALWYAFNLLLAGWAVHRFALAVLPDETAWSRRWWYLRLLPFDFCIPGIGFSLNRGQVNILALALLAEMLLASRRRRGIASGWWLAAAGALKVIPGLLVLYPLLTKQWKAYLGVAAGSVACFAVIPAAVWGLDGAWTMNRNFFELVASPGLTNTGDTSRSVELTNATSSDSQSFHAIFNNIRHPERRSRPDNSDALSKGLHYLLGLSMIAATLLRARRIPNLLDSPAEAMIVFGSFCIIMVHLAPASHMHYYLFAMPTVMGLIAQELIRRPDRVLLSGRSIAGLALWTTCVGIAMIDSFAWSLRLREVGLAAWATVALWGYSLTRVR